MCTLPINSGNNHFKANNVDKALAKYDKALRYLQEESPSPEEIKQIAAVLQAIINILLAHHFDYLLIPLLCYAMLWYVYNMHDGVNRRVWSS